MFAGSFYINVDVGSWDVSNGEDFVSATISTRFLHDYYDIDIISHQNLALINILTSLIHDFTEV